MTLQALSGLGSPLKGSLILWMAGFLLVVEQPHDIQQLGGKSKSWRAPHRRFLTSGVSHVGGSHIGNFSHSITNIYRVPFNGKMKWFVCFPVP
jgi:hypothetical protein